MTDRRQFFKLGAAGLSSLLGAGFSKAARPDVARELEHGTPLQEVPYAQVSLPSCLQQSQLEGTHGVLMSLNEDSLLRPYRLRVGAAAPGCNLGGWYSSDGFAGETFGQWLSALSRYHAITGDEATRLKVGRLVRGFAATVDASGRIYGNPKETTGPAYHYDKLVCGLMDAHQFAGEPAALGALKLATDAVLPLLPDHAVDYNPTDTGAHESYTLTENQLLAWQRGAPARHLTIARQYLYDSFFLPLARGENVLAGRHAYSHVNALSSAAKAYLVLGDSTYLRAAVNGLRFVEAQSFATGGWGPNETFLPSPSVAWSGLPAINTLGDSLGRSHAHFETPCGSYAHFKLTRYLLRITKDPTYGDSMERVMYNTVLGAKKLQRDGRAFYQSDYNPCAHKTYFDGYGGEVLSEWPCCSGTLPQVAADYRISTYFLDSHGVYVNLFIPSTLTWQIDGVAASLTQSGDYPLTDELTFAITLAQSKEFALHIRIPAWSVNPSLSVNGRATEQTARPGTFASVRRQWRSGDRIELKLPRRVQLKAVDSQHPNVVAICDGPLVLFALGMDIPQVSAQQALTARQTSPTSGEWVIAISDTERLRLVPFWAVPDSAFYSPYLQLRPDNPRQSAEVAS